MHGIWRKKNLFNQLIKHAITVFHDWFSSNLSVPMRRFRGLKERTRNVRARLFW